MVMIVSPAGSHAFSQFLLQHVNRSRDDGDAKDDQERIRAPVATAVDPAVGQRTGNQHCFLLSPVRRDHTGQTRLWRALPAPNDLPPQI